MIMRSLALILVLVLSSFLYSTEDGSYYTIEDGVTLRKGPGLSYPVIGYLKPYTQLMADIGKSQSKEKIEEHNEHWYHVVGSAFGDPFQGWVYGAFIKKMTHIQAKKKKDQFVRELPLPEVHPDYSNFINTKWIDQEKPKGGDFFGSYKFKRKVAEEYSFPFIKIYKITGVIKNKSELVLTATVLFLSYYVKNPNETVKLTIKRVMGKKYILVNGRKFYPWKK
ncbi:MAG: SH3 domain-containing protein [Spirochaetota bacterium]|nr:SH3 domain-containing protein [Spirochaetota bacterium]